MRNFPFYDRAYAYHICSAHWSLWVHVNQMFSWSTDIKFSWLGQYLHFDKAWTHHIWSTLWSSRIDVVQASVTCALSRVHGLLISLNLYQGFVIRTAFLTIHPMFAIFGPTLIMGGTCPYFSMVFLFSLFSKKKKFTRDLHAQTRSRS